MALASLTIATAHAQIGWTLEQCKAKYGEATENKQLGYQGDAIDILDSLSGWESPIQTFKSSGFEIAVWLHEGTVLAIGYTPDKGGTLTGNQVRQILAKFSPTKWKQNHNDDVESDCTSRFYTLAANKHELRATMQLGQDFLDDMDLDKSGAAYVVIDDATVQKQVDADKDAKKDKEDSEKAKGKEEKIQQGINNL